MLRSRIGNIASAAASKREKLRAGNYPSRSLSTSASPSPTTSSAFVWDEGNNIFVESMIMSEYKKTVDVNEEAG